MKLKKKTQKSQKKLQKNQKNRKIIKVTAENVVILFVFNGNTFIFNAKNI